MQTLLTVYEHTILSIGVLSLIMFCQIVVADVVGIKSKHIPGSQIPSDHGSLLFRSSRAVSNASDNIGVYILAVLFCMLSQASPVLTAYASWAYVVTRLLYAVFYYANLKILRSVSFAVSVFALLALIILGLSS